jgi:hypothetical protein
MLWAKTLRTASPTKSAWLKEGRMTDTRGERRKMRMAPYYCKEFELQGICFRVRRTGNGQNGDGAGE